MALPPIPPVTLDALTAVALGDGIREGRILEARVTALISNTLARLEINGQPLVVATPKPLPVGAALTLKVERDAGELKLVVQGPLRDVTETAVRAPPLERSTTILAEPVRAALAKIQTMVGAQPTPAAGAVAKLSLEQILASVSAATPEPVDRAPMDMLKTTLAKMSVNPGRGVLDDAPAPAAANASTGKAPEPSLDAKPARLPNKVADPLLTPMAESSLDETLALPGSASRQKGAAPGASAPHGIPREHHLKDATPPAYLADAASRSADDVGRTRRDTLEPPHFRVLTDAPPAPVRTEHTATVVIDIPVFLPGNTTPLRLHITEHENADSEDGDSERSPYWTVRFAAEAGHLGMVHASISLIDGHIGVQLWAERGETAEQFKLNAPQLREALQASDLKLDGVSIAEGSPFSGR